jgi:hypothetical protein
MAVLLPLIRKRNRENGSHFLKSPKFLWNKPFHKGVFYYGLYHSIPLFQKD